MASNAKTKERKAKRDSRRQAAWSKMRKDINKVRATGGFPTHYVGGGQPYTRGKFNVIAE